MDNTKLITAKEKEEILKLIIELSFIYNFPGLNINCIDWDTGESNTETEIFKVYPFTFKKQLQGWVSSANFDVPMYEFNEIKELYSNEYPYMFNTINISLLTYPVFSIKELVIKSISQYINNLYDHTFSFYELNNRNGFFEKQIETKEFIPDLTKRYPDGMKIKVPKEEINNCPRYNKIREILNKNEL